MTLPLRLAAVGLGWVALHRHFPAIIRHPDLKLVGVVDRHAGHAKKVAKRYNLSHYSETETLDSLTWLDDVDAITIGAPPKAHAPLILEALKRGKHVLTEKPFVLNEAEGEAIVRAARDAKKTLAIVHNFQFSRAANKLNAAIANGRLGTIRRIAAVQLGNPRRRLPSWYEELPLGLFYDESPHFFYLLDSLSGGSLRLEHAHGVAGQKGENTPSLVHLLYRNAKNIPITIDCQFDSSVSEWFVRVTGDKATAIIDIFRDIYIHLPNDNTHKALDILRTSGAAFFQHIAQHIPNGLALLAGHLDYGNDEIFNRFATAIRTGHADEKIGPDKALAVLKLQHEATRAIQGSFYP